jgi:simple sugar transport system ATP-binding protein
MKDILSIRGMCKYFPGVTANEQVDLDIRFGEIHALLGENGAGKTTLRNCIFGLYIPEAGDIYWKGKKVKINNSKDAISLGIGMVHQHFMLVHNFTVLENIILGSNAIPGLLLNRKKAREELSALIEQYGLKVDLDTQIWQLPVGMQQRVEIIKALYRNAEVLILDEPTAVLTPQETREFFEILRRLRDKNHSVIIITHKLGEVMEIADRVTVLRLVRVVDGMDIKEANPNILASAMVGKEMKLSYTKRPCNPGRVLLAAGKICCRNEKNIEVVREAEFELKAGKILGVAGVSGNGQTELAEALCGLRHIHSGRVSINGRDVTNLPPAEFYRNKLSHVPEDRQAVGLVMDFTLAENAIVGCFKNSPFSKNGIMDYKAVNNHCGEIIKKYDVRSSGIHTAVRLLSGGNQQKLIVGREIEKKPDVFIAVQPTRGLDIAATEFIQEQILDQRDKGCGILYISTELEEIFKMSDDIIVLFEGRQYGPFPYDRYNLETIGLMMAGSYPREDTISVKEAVL